MLGTIAAFKDNGWQVDRYIVGDKVPESWLRDFESKQKSKAPFFLKLLIADALRLLLSAYHVTCALRELHDLDWVYERYGALQFFGYFFKRRGAVWVLETNAPLFLEASRDVRTVSFPWLVKWYERLAYKNCDVLVVVSEELKRIMIARFQIPEDKIVVLPNAADVELFDPASVNAKRLFSDDSFVVGFQGSLYKWAGVEMLIRSVAALRKQGIPIAAVILGDGAERQPLECLAKELDVADFVIFPGRVAREMVPAYIAGYDLCYSGQVKLSADSMYLSPLKLYDYMAMAKPVIASRFADAVKLIGDDERGYLFESGDLGSLLEKLRYAYSERERSLEKGHLAREEILANHTWKARIKSLIETVDEVVAEPLSR